ncbi:MAG: class I SAM-dependent RNA methyltransferase [Victivallales bacterium]|nr:class I SAM-dependent RNA methyltransferase [Victivallales bacterium]
MGKKRKAKIKKPSAPKIELDISSVAYGGRGVGRTPEGKVLFVPGTLSGEIAVVEVTADRGDYLLGSVVEIKRASPKRIESNCLVHSGFDNTGKEYFVTVPGCVYQNFAYDEELRVKNEQFVEFIRRALSDSDASFSEIKLTAPAPSPRPLNYRNKTTLHVCDDNSEILLGYHREGSRSVVEIPECPLSHPGINDALRELRGTTGFRSTLRDGMTLTFRSTKNDGVIFWRNKPGGNESWLKESTVLGSVSVPWDGFFQVNPEVANILIGRVVAAVEEFAPKSVVDLYCGCGLFSLATAKAGIERISGLDSDASTIEAARYNLKKAGSQDAILSANFAEKGFKELLAKHKSRMGGSLSETLLIVDPPRSGLARNVKGSIAASDLKGIIYISCSPDTLSRDIRELVRAGFAVRSAGMLDMFPRTSHFESLIVLSNNQF